MKRSLFVFLVLMMISSSVVLAGENIVLIEEAFKDGQSYNYVFNYSEGLAPVNKDDFFTGKWGYINEEGEEVIPPIYDLVSDFKEGLAPVRRGGKWGYINKKGETVIPFIYRSASPFSQGLAAVSNEDSMYGFIDKTGREVIPHHFSSAGEFSQGLAHVRGNYYDTPLKSGHIDKRGQIVTSFQYDETGPFVNGLAFFRQDGKYGFIDKKNQVIIPATYDRVSKFTNGVASVSLDDQWKLIDKSGKAIANLDYNYVGVFGNDGLASVSKDGKSGFINEKGELVIPLIYHDVGGFNEGVALVGRLDQDGIMKNGYIDRNGKELTPFIYTSGTYMNEGLATVNESSVIRRVRPGDQKPKKEVPKEKELVAKPNNLKLLIDGREVLMESYLINDTSYFKLRDLAYALKDSPRRFNVSWNNGTKSIHLNSGQDYLPLGGEMEVAKKLSPGARASRDKLFINGQEESLDAYTIGGNNYFKLRDLGKHLFFHVDYNGEMNQIEVATSENLGLTIKGQEISLGEGLDSLIGKLGQPDRIDDQVTNLKWYVYNRDYSKFIMLGLLDDQVASIYTSHTDFTVNEDISYGVYPEDLPSSPNIDYYMDEYGGNILYGIMLKADPKLGLWKDGIDKNKILPTYELQEFDALNAFRVYKGLNPLALDKVAGDVAREHSRDMGENDFVGHTGSDGSGHVTRYLRANGKHLPIGENVAGGARDGLNEFKNFLNSEGHRKGMIFPDLDYLGIGVYYKEDSTYKFYGTQLLIEKQ